MSTQSINETKVVNFMGGVSFELDPFKTMQLVVTSTIRGESHSTF